MQLRAGSQEPFLEVSTVGGMPGPATGHLIWHRPSPRWRARWRQRVEMLLCSYMIGSLDANEGDSGFDFSISI